MLNYQRAPALGVGPILRFSWAVPPAPSAAAAATVQRQSSYRITVVDAASGALAWSSGSVASAASLNVEVNGTAPGVNLKPGAGYLWTVACDGGAASDPAGFVTSLWAGFAADARWIWAADTKRAQVFANFRHVVTAAEVPRGKTVASALLYATAWQEPTMLSAYKVYVGGVLVSLGPGRGEADVLAGDSAFKRAPYNAVNITAAMRGGGGGGGGGAGTVVAVEGMAPLFQTPCDLHACTDRNTAGGGVLLQIELVFTDGTAGRIATKPGPAWAAEPYDAYYNPTAPGTSVPGMAGLSAYAKVQEHIDASHEAQHDWRTAAAVGPSPDSPDRPDSPPGWPAAVASRYQNRSSLIARMARPLQTYRPADPTTTRFADPTGSGRPSFFVDFGREFQGGVVLDVKGGAKGAVFRIISGELLLPGGAMDNTTGSRLDPARTWGYDTNWTLRDGDQRLVQHNYMLFRYLAVTLVAGELPASFAFSGWGVKYEYAPADSGFASSNATLNRVWELARWTLDGGVVDTYTDSNTRERRPYECDGLVAATARGLLQNDPMWGRHGASWVLEVPTWPVEWQQMAAVLAYLDYSTTGSPDLFETYEARLHARTNIGALDGTGLINTSTGRHLVGWDPPPTKEMFVNNGHTSVCNGWAITGLEKLAAMATAAGNGANASVYRGQAAGIRAAMLAQMWDPGAGRFCDGPCADPAVRHHGGPTTNYFTTYFDLVPEAAAAGVWRAMAASGLEGIGDYGAFVFLSALARRPADDGTAMLTALTKCDAASWCNEMVQYNATMTTESLGLPHATMSHPWGTGAVPAVVHGVMGIHQTTPTWASFSVRPLLASLRWANITVPTVRGPITVHATPHSVATVVPCTAAATLCLYRPHGGGVAKGVPPRLVLDGSAVAAVRAEGGFLCAAEPVGCGPGPRVLTALPGE